MKDKGFRLRALGVVLCLLVTNVLNLLIPRQVGIIMDCLSGEDHNSPWIELTIFVGLKVLASDIGMPQVRGWIWAPVEFLFLGSLRNAAHSRVISLSSDSSDPNSTNDATIAVKSGLSAFRLLETLCFDAVPSIVDVVVAFAYLSATIGPYEGLITSTTAIIFTSISARMISEIQQTYGKLTAWYDEQGVRRCGLQGSLTATALSQISFEERRHAVAVQKYVDRACDAPWMTIVAHGVRYFVLLCGLAVGSALAAHQVIAVDPGYPASGRTRHTPGEFMMLLTYWGQLTVPLAYFACLGKNIASELVNTERLLAIMRLMPNVANRSTGVLSRFDGSSGCAVEFKGVSFSYDASSRVLDDVSFRVQPGMIVAVVGQTGAGKSTLLKLLGRFYDVTDGAILIDGQDIRDVDIQRWASNLLQDIEAPVSMLTNLSQHPRQHWFGGPVAHSTQGHNHEQYSLC